MPAAGPSMKNNVFMGEVSSGCWKQRFQGVDLDRALKNNVFMGARQLESLENNVSKVANWTARVENIFFGIVDDLKPEKHCITAKK